MYLSGLAQSYAGCSSLGWTASMVTQLDITSQSARADIAIDAQDLFSAHAKLLPIGGL